MESSALIARLRQAAVATLVATLITLLPDNSPAADMHVVTSGAPAAVQKRLAPAFKADTGHGLVITAATLAKIRQRLAGDVQPDVLVLPRPVINQLQREGALDADSIVDLARVGIGVAVRDGAPVPDVSTPDALIKTLLAARSIGHPDPKGGGFAGLEIDRMFERLGIAEKIRPKVVLMFAFSGGVASIAKGTIELGLFNISEILPVAGVRLAGPLPQELQKYLTFAGALHVRSAAPEAGRAYLRYLQSASAAEAWRLGGFDMLSPGKVLP